MNGRGGDGGRARAVAFQIAAGGDLRHAEQAADLEHEACDLGESGLVGADIHQRAQEAGVGAGSPVPAHGRTPMQWLPTSAATVS